MPRTTHRYGVARKARNGRWIVYSHAACEQDARSCLAWAREQDDQRYALAQIVPGPRYYRVVPGSINEVA